MPPEDQSPGGGVGGRRTLPPVSSGARGPVRASARAPVHHPGGRAGPTPRGGGPERGQRDRSEADPHRAEPTGGRRGHDVRREPPGLGAMGRDVTAAPPHVPGTRLQQMRGRTRAPHAFQGSSSRRSRSGGRRPSTPPATEEPPIPPHAMMQRPTCQMSELDERVCWGGGDGLIA